MVELASAPYDYYDIPFVSASVVSIDAELSEDTIVTAEAIHDDSSPLSSITTTNDRESSIPEDQSSRSFPTSYHNESEGNGDNDHQHQQQNVPTPDEARESQRTIGAGAAGAIMGLLVGGPVLSIVFGFGTVYYTKQEGATGDLARALGEVALVARDKWKEVDSKHHIVDQSREAANEAMHRMQEADRRHHGREKFFKFVAYCWKSTLQFVEQHQLVDKGCDQIKILAEKLSEKIQEHHSRVRDCPHHHHNHHDGERTNTPRQ